MNEIESERTGDQIACHRCGYPLKWCTCEGGDDEPSGEDAPAQDEEAPLECAPAQDEAAAPTEAGTLLVTVPEGVSAGMQLEIQAPDGRTLAVTVPEGVLPGQQLQVNA